jgi:hypothetical protein
MALENWTSPSAMDMGYTGKPEIDTPRPCEGGQWCRCATRTPCHVPCLLVCPGHHYRVGAGESLMTGISWCPGVERADDEDWDALCAD